MTETLRNTITAGSICMVIIIRLAVDWIKEALRK